MRNPFSPLGSRAEQTKASQETTSQGLATSLPKERKLILSTNPQVVHSGIVQTTSLNSGNGLASSYHNHNPLLPPLPPHHCYHRVTKHLLIIALC